MSHKIIQGNVFDVLPTLEKGSVVAVCTSPPYWRLRSYLPKDLIQELSSLVVAKYALVKVSKGSKERKRVKITGKEIVITTYENNITLLRKIKNN